MEKSNSHIAQDLFFVYNTMCEKLINKATEIQHEKTIIGFVPKNSDLYQEKQTSIIDKKEKFHEIYKTVNEMKENIEFFVDKHKENLSSVGDEIFKRLKTADEIIIENLT